MELRHLRYFVAVAEHLHFGRAADELHIAQPSVSQQIRQLENELGVALFERSKRRVRLTEAGRQFLEEARHILTRTHHAALVARRANLESVERIRVGFAYWMDVAALSTIVTRFAEEQPAVHVEMLGLSVPRQLIALRERHLDVAFVRPPLGEPSLRGEVILAEPLVAAVPANPQQAQRQRVPWSALKSDRFVFFPREVVPRFYDFVVKMCGEAGFVPQVRTEADQPQMLLGMVAAGLGISLVPASANRMRPDGVVFLPLRPSKPILETAVAWRSNDESPLVSRFVQIARAWARTPARQRARRMRDRVTS